MSKSINKNESLWIVYKYLDNSTSSLDSNGAKYFVYKCFNETGVIEKETLDQHYFDFVGGELLEDTNLTGPFPSLEDITKFGFQICQEMDLPSVGLMSIDDFNQALSTTDTSVGLIANLPSVSNMIENPEHGKGGFFGKIFS